MSYSRFSDGDYIFRGEVLSWDPENLSSMAVEYPKMPPVPETEEQYYESFLQRIYQETQGVLVAALESVEKVKLSKIRSTRNAYFPVTDGNPMFIKFHGATLIGAKDFGPLEIACLVESPLFPGKKIFGIASTFEGVELLLIPPNEVTVSTSCFEKDSEFILRPLDSLLSLERMFFVCTEKPYSEVLRQAISGKATAWDLSRSAVVSSGAGAGAGAGSGAGAGPRTRATTKMLSGPLNPSQTKALACFTGADSGFYLLQGPPGTGKTTTIVAMLEHLLEDKTMICAPSNKAVQVIARRALEKMPSVPMALIGVKEKVPPELLDIFVHGWCSRMLKALQSVHGFSLPTLINAFQRNPDQKIKYLEEVITFLRERVAVGKRQLPGWFKLEEAAFSYLEGCVRFLRALDPTQRAALNNAGGEYAKAYGILYSDAIRLFNTLLNKLSMTDDNYIVSLMLRRSPFIFCTLCVAGRKSMREKVPLLDNLIVDEAGQSVEAETLIPFGLTNFNKVLLVGDTKQLPATTIAPTSERNSFARSMMWRLMEDCKQPHHMLNVQYRMHPEIRSWPSRRFYADLLEDGENVTTREVAVVLPTGVQPCVFVNIDGREELFGHSFQNRLEAQCIVAYVKQVRAEGQKHTIGIIAFYNAQVDLIRRMLRHQNLLDEVTVSSVDGFQGDERDQIILSFVRANRRGNIGFVKDFRRLNVAITRAKHSLLMFGSVLTLSQKRGGDDVFALVEDCRSRRMVVRYDALGVKLPTMPAGAGAGSGAGRGKTYKGRRSAAPPARLPRHAPRPPVAKPDWSMLRSKYSKGQRVEGTIIKIIDVGLVIQLEPKVEALLHKSRFGGRNPRLFKRGQKVTVTVFSVNVRKQTISLNFAPVPRPRAALALGLADRFSRLTVDTESTVEHK